MLPSSDLAMRPLRIVPVPLLLGAVLATALAACGGDTKGEAGTSPAADPGGLPGDLFLEVTVYGGFVPPDADFRAAPSLVVFADGRVVVPAEVPAIYPGPAVAPLATGTLDADSLAALVEEAGDAGLLAAAAPPLDLPPDVGIADAPSTHVRLVVGGREREFDAPALGLLESETPARRALDRFIATARQEAEAVAVDELDPERYRVRAAPAGPTPAGVEGRVIEWPDGLPTPTVGGCVAVGGAASDDLEEALARADDATRWLVGGEELALAFRPVLPHEDDCPED